MKTYRLFLIVAAMINSIVFPCWVSAETNESLQIYVNEEKGVKLFHPPGWYSKSFVSNKHFILRLTQENPVRERFEVAIVLVKTDLKSVTKSRFKRDIHEYIKLITHFSNSPNVTTIHERRSKHEDIHVRLSEELIFSQTKSARLYHYEQRSAQSRYELYLFAADDEFEYYRDKFELIMKKSEFL